MIDQNIPKLHNTYQNALDLSEQYMLEAYEFKN